METILPFVPPHPLTDTYWVEWVIEVGHTTWMFQEKQLVGKLPNGNDFAGNWSVVGDILTLEVTVGIQPANYTANFTRDLLRTGRTMELKTAGLPSIKLLTYDGRVSYPETGEFSREWYYFWNHCVPQKGQADTLQGEILRVTHVLGAVYGNSGSGELMGSPNTLEAYAELIVAVLCDGTLEEHETEFVRRTVTGLQHHCAGQTDAAPDDRDVSRLSDLALEWCKSNLHLIPRSHDPRMQF